MRTTSPRRLRRITAIILFAPFAILLSYGFVCGVVDAELQDGRLPAMFHRVAEIQRVPAIAAAGIPVIGEIIKAGDYFGYDFAGGPETTR
jgi:hypothetical protein